MEIKNSINILFAKFGVNYRVLLYMFISMAIVIAIAVSIIIPSFSAAFNSPIKDELFTEMRIEFRDYVLGTNSFKDLTEAFINFINEFSVLLDSTNATTVFWITFAVMCILIRFAASFCFPVITDIINNFMGSNMKYGFMSNMLKNVKVCVKYALFHTLLSSLADILILFAIIGLIKLFLPIINIGVFALALVIAIILLSVRLSLSAGVVPEMIVGGEKRYFMALKNSWPMVKRNFLKLMGNYCITLFCTYCLIILLSVVTFGVAFFVLATVFITFIHIVQLVIYYGDHNMRYYTDSSTIVNTAPIEDRIDLQEELIRHDND